MPGCSLTVLQIKSLLNDRLKEKEPLNLQTDRLLTDFKEGAKILGLPKTELIPTGEDSRFIKYTVSLSTSTIRKPIYIYKDGFEDPYYKYLAGYQEIETFDICFDKNYSNLYIFASKAIANDFVRRLKKHNVGSFSHIKFDFSRITLLQKLICAWGAWEDSIGIVKRTGKFGPGLETILTQGDYDSMTTVYIDYDYGHDKTMQLILSRDGRVAIYNKASNKDLVKIFDDIKEVLIS